jgi:hypothetical protein
MENQQDSQLELKYIYWLTQLKALEKELHNRPQEL